MPDISCLGILVADIITKPVDKIPQKGFVELVDKIELHTGGCAVNTGKALQILGAETAVLGKIGDDIFGDFLLNDLRAYGLDISGVIKDDKTPTSSTTVLSSSDGERSFLHLIGANAVYNISDVRWDIIEKSKILHIGGFFVLPALDGKPAADMLKKAKDMGKITSLDTVYDAKGNWYDLLKEPLPYVDYFLPSYEEARLSSGEDEPERIADFFLDKGVGCVAIKLGEKGSYVSDGSFKKLFPAHKVDVVESTGAGDAYVAGFLMGVLKEWDIEKTALFANTVGTMSVMAVGASGGIKSYMETEKKMNEWS